LAGNGRILRLERLFLPWNRLCTKYNGGMSSPARFSGWIFSVLSWRCIWSVVLPLTSLGDLAAGAGEWPVYGGNFGATKYSPLKKINTRNVGRLKPAWIYHCDDMTERPASTIECNPLVIGGKMFLTTPGLKLLALDAETGKEIWRFDPWGGERGRGVNRGLAYWSDGREGRLFFVAGMFLNAIDSATGKLVQSFGTDGKIDLRDGLDRDVYYLTVTATSPGVVYKDLFIIGSVVGGRAESVRTWTHSCIRREDGKTEVDISHNPASGRIWL
jgi:glucose dehydrogenase